MAEDRSSAGDALRRVPTVAVLLALGLVGALTVAAAAQGRWTLTVAGLVLLQLGTAVAVVGPWGARRATGRSAPAETSAARVELQDLERRVDAAGARLVASTERTRVELLDALRGRTTDAPGDGQR